MRHGKIRKQLRKPAPRYTTAEKLQRRRAKRKKGPSAMRRAMARHDLFVGPCGCIRAKHGLMPCKEHGAKQEDQANKRLSYAAAIALEDGKLL